MLLLYVQMITITIGMWSMIIMKIENLGYIPKMLYLALKQVWMFILELKTLIFLSPLCIYQHKELWGEDQCLKR